MSTRPNSDDRLTPTQAAWVVTEHVHQLVLPDAIRRAARRINALDANGTIARAVVERMRDTYALTNFLVRRGARSVEHACAGPRARRSGK